MNNNPDPHIKNTPLESPEINTTSNIMTDNKISEDFIDKLNNHLHIFGATHTTDEQQILCSVQSSLKVEKWEILDNCPSFPKWINLTEAKKIGKCSGTIQTSPEELLAFIYLTGTHHARNSHIAANGPNGSKYPLKTIQVVNDHHHITYSCRKLPPPLAPRDWLTRGIWQQLDKDNFILVFVPVPDNNPDLPNFAKSSIQGVVRGEVTAIHHYERRPHNQTRYTLTTNVFLKGSVPKNIANMGMSGLLDSVRRAHMYFQRDEEIDELEVSLLEIICKCGATLQHPPS